jgi:hypothetical protein
MTWPIDNPELSGLKYPLTPVGRVELEEAYYELGVAWSPLLVYRMSECIDPFDSTQCSRGADLEANDDKNPFYASLIHGKFPDCGKAVDLSKRPATIRDGITGEERKLAGGATSRFAFFVDCGKCYPSKESPLRLERALAKLIRDVMDCECDEIGDFY